MLQLRSSAMMKRTFIFLDCADAREKSISIKPSNIEPHKYDIKPEDYLEFAKNSLKEQGVGGAINTIGHIKRALHCQADTFLKTHKLYSVIEKSNADIIDPNKQSKNEYLDFHQKIGFLASIGNFSGDG